MKVVIILSPICNKMNNSEIENWIKTISKILKSSKTKLSTEDRDALVIIREQLSNAKTKTDIVKPMKALAKIIGILSVVFSKIKQ